MQVRSEVTIAAPIERVWALTVDIEHWPQLTPTMLEVDRLDAGPLRVGSRVRVTQPRQRPGVWVVTHLEAPTLFAWRRTLLGMTIIATHRLEPIGGGCRNTLTVEVTGRGATLFSAVMSGPIRAAIQTENAGFREVAERLTIESRSADGEADA
jgi:uncharacterized protein YndB with AHSA1/START domain